MSSDSAIFDEEFFGKLKKTINKLFDFVKDNWIFGVLFLGILIIAFIIQQIILYLLLSVL